MKLFSGTKLRILEGALQILESKGIQCLTQPAVAKEVGIPQGQLTYHFPKRADLVNAVAHATLDAMADAVFQKEFRDVSEGKELGPFVKLLLSFLKMRSRSRALFGLILEADENPEVKAKVAELVTSLQRTQEQSGGWAHGPGGPNALGYLELEIVSNYALLGLGAARRLGVEPDEAAVGKALAWIESTASADGGMGYSPRDGQKGFGDPGRTAGALVAYASLGQKRRPFFEDMAGFYARRQGDLEGGHVSPCMHLLAGAMAGRLLGDAWKAYMERYRLTIMAARKPDGSFASTPTQESQSLHSNTDLTVGPCWTTATYVTILSLPGDRLPLLLGGDGGSEPSAGKREASGR